MNVEFLEPAELEFHDTINFLNSESEGLGYEFAAEVRNTIERIVQYPNAWHPLSKKTRRCRTKRFPYSIIYQIHSHCILIIAIMHMHRNPESWKKRIKNKL